MKKKILLLLSILACAGTCYSATLITQSFGTAAPGSTTPEGWFSTNENATEIVSLAGINYQRIWRNSSNGGSAAVYYTGSQGEVVNGLIQDFNAEMTLRMGGTFPQNATLRGVVARAQTLATSGPDGEGFWGYSIGFIATGDNRGLYIYENPTATGTAGLGTLRAYDDFEEDLTANTQYLFRISAQGEALSASLWSADGEVMLASVLYDEAEVIAGYFGLRSAHANSVANTAFRDLTLEVTAVPEPTVAVLLLSGVVCIWGIRRRRAGS